MKWYRCMCQKEKVLFSWDKSKNAWELPINRNTVAGKSPHSDIQFVRSIQDRYRSLEKNDKVFQINDTEDLYEQLGKMLLDNDGQYLPLAFHQWRNASFICQMMMVSYKNTNGFSPVFTIRDTTEDISICLKDDNSDATELEKEYEFVSWQFDDYSDETTDLQSFLNPDSSSNEVLCNNFKGKYNALSLSSYQRYRLFTLQQVPKLQVRATIRYFSENLNLLVVLN